MSGPKVSHYELERTRKAKVKQQLEDLLPRIAQARSRYSAIKLEASAAKLEYHKEGYDAPVDIPELPFDKDKVLESLLDQDVYTVTAYLQHLEQHHGQTEILVHSEVARVKRIRHERVGLEQKLEAAKLNRTEFLDEISRIEQEIIRQSLAEKLPHWAQEAKRISVYSQAFQYPKVREKVDELCAQLQAEKDESQANLLLARMRVENQNLEKHHRAYKPLELEAQALLGSAIMLEDLALDQELAELREALAARTLSASLLDSARGAVKRVRQQCAASYVATTIEEALEQLGYEVGETFSTLVIEGGEVIVSKPNDPKWKGHGLRVLMSPENETIHTRIVQDGQPAIPTGEVEELFCTDFAELNEKLVAEGIGLDTFYREAPGASAPRQIEVVAKRVVAGQKTDVVRRTRKRTKAREKTMG